MATDAHQPVSGGQPPRHVRRMSEAVRNHHLSARQVADRLAAERAASAQNEAQGPLTPNQGPSGAG